MPDQDILSLGLDVSSFDAQKKAVLNEYIALFDKLSQYDGKTINPINVGGLREFNNTVATTNKLLDEINTKLSNLKSASYSGMTSNASALQAEIKRLSSAVTEQEKQIAALNLKLSESTKEIIKEEAAIKSSSAAKKENSNITKEEIQNSRTQISILRQLEKSKLQQGDRADAAIKELEILKTKQLSEEKRKQAKEERDLAAAKKLSDAESRRDIQNKAAESQVVKNLTNDYYLLKQAMIDQATKYSNLYINKGKNAPETKEALLEYSRTVSVIDAIDKKLADAQPKAFGLGKGLSTIYNQVRILAYVLPGLGIAGIFNLAFEAIQKAAGGLELLNNREKEFYDNQVAINKTLEDQLGLYDEIIKRYQQLRDVPNTGGINQNQQVNLQQSEGYDAISLLNNKKVLIESELIRTTGDILKHTGNSPETLKLDLDRRLSVQKDYADQIKRISDQINSIENPDKNKGPQRDINGKILQIQGTTDASKDVLERLKSEKKLYEEKLQLSQKSYEADKAYLDKYTQDQEEFFNIKVQLDHAISEDKRKSDYEAFKNEVALNKDKNEKILNDNKSTEQEKLSALSELNVLQKKLNNEERDYVLTNINATKGEKDIAVGKARIENARSDIKSEIDRINLKEQYRQKRLDAQRDIDKSELDSTAITNERIYQNDEKALDERLKAYANYVSAKQKIQDIEYKRDIDTLSPLAAKGDPTAILGITALQKQRDEQKVSNQADVENKVYDIVFSSLEKQFHAIKLENDSELREDEKKYTDELNKLNDSFNKKELSYEKYRKRLKEIEKKYTISGLDEKISQDESDVFRLKSFLDNLKSSQKELDKGVEEAQIGVTVANQFGGDNLQASKALDTAVGKQKANAEEIKRVSKSLSDAQNTLTDDQNKRAKAGITTREKGEKSWYEYAIKIERELYRSVKSIVDQSYEYKLQLVERQKELVDEQYGYEIAAIEKSSLSAKDKAALDIQLAQQKMEYDKRAQLEEKRLKIEQAEFDKKLTITHIILSTAEAIAEASPNPAKMITAGAVGATELGVAIGTPIPSFKEGVEDFEGGYARYGEDGSEIVKIPHKAPFLVRTETISYLPKGTDIIPVEKEIDLEPRVIDNSWEQTIWLSKQFKKAFKQPNIRNVNVIKIDMGFEEHKRKILGN